LGIIGLIIVVLVACNYTNLATVLTFSRAKEVGIRKVTGSRSGALFRQFIVESILLVFMGLMFAIGIVQVVLPYFNEVTGKELSLDYTDPRFILGLCVFVIVLGLLSGLYPALRFSSFNPVSALKGQVALKGNRIWLRNFLVIFQFTICIIMIVSTLVVYKQLSFMTNKNVGFEKDQILIIKRPDGLGKSKMAFKNELLQNAAVTAVSITQTIPGRNFDGHGQHFQGRPADEWVTIYPLVADPDIFKILDLKIVSGQPLSDSLGTQAVLNESAVRMLKTTNPFDLTIDKGTLGNFEVDVVGVVKDFHFKSFYFPIEPLVIYPLDVENDSQHRATFILAKINNRNIATSVGDIEKVWKKFAPSYPFEYTFLDEDFNRLFERERTMTKVYTVFSVISVCIACLGLLGLSSYFANKRTKEIGIRKIVGASFLNIAEILSIDFLKWIMVAIVLGSLISWFLMHQWLQNFAYKTELSMWIFLVAAICVVFISILTVSWHLFKAATRNPVETLRYE
jgi:putative ABC transport system permease protein